MLRWQKTGIHPVIPRVIPRFFMECNFRIHAAIFSFIVGVMPPMPMLDRSLL